MPTDRLRSACNSKGIERFTILGITFSTVIDPIYELSPWEQMKYMNGMMRSRLTALEWVLGEINDIEDSIK